MIFKILSKKASKNVETFLKKKTQSKHKYSVTFVSKVTEQLSDRSKQNLGKH